MYVDVLAEFSKDGLLIPKEITWEDGRKYEITRVKDKRRAASTRAGGVGERYTCVVDGKEIFLFYLLISLCMGRMKKNQNCYLRQWMFFQIWMNCRTKKTNNKRFVRYSEGAEMYSMSVSKFMQLAKDAKACYKVNQLVLVNLDIIDEYLETFHIVDDEFYK